MTMDGVFLIYLTLIRAKPIKTRSGSIVKLVTLWKRRNCDDWSSNAVLTKKNKDEREIDGW